MDARLRMDYLQGNALNVPMSGLSPTFTASSANNYTASVEISPIVARVELTQVTCQNATVGSPISTDIPAYKLAGMSIGLRTLFSIRRKPLTSLTTAIYR